MKLSIATFYLMLGLVVASQPTTQFPSCTVDCMNNTISQSACTLDNIATCLCDDTEFYTIVTQCVETSCTVKEGLTTKNATATLCHWPYRDISSRIIALESFFGPLALVAVLIRVTVKAVLSSSESFGWDDWTIIVAVVLDLCSSALTISSAKKGLGKDIWTLSFPDLTETLMTFYYDAAVYKLCTALTKVSILFFYLRIFKTSQVAWFRAAIYFLMPFCICFGIAFSLADILHCQPISYFWEKWDGEHQGHCANFNAISWAHAILDVLLDICILIIPMPQVARLKLPFKKKFLVGAMLGVGFIVTIICMLRVPTIVRFAKTPNPTYDSIHIRIWSLLEVHLSIVCVCMPALRLAFVSVYRRFYQRIQGRQQTSYISQSPRKYKPGRYTLSLMKFRTITTGTMTTAPDNESELGLNRSENASQPAGH